MAFSENSVFNESSLFKNTNDVLENTNNHPHHPVLNNIVRPFRVGVSIAIAPSLDRLVLFVQARLKVSKVAAIAVTIGLVNVVGTVLLMCGVFYLPLYLLECR